MRIICHTGAHATDEERLLKCLLKNKEVFSQRGISVPGPGKYRTILKESFLALDSSEPALEARDVLVDLILDDERADRLILSNSHFFGSPRFALGEGRLYPLASLRLQQLQLLFDGDRIEMFMGLCNPATFLPKVLQRASDEQKAEILAANDPLALRWSELIERIRDEVPDVDITVWCNEDTPLIWGEIMRAAAGLEADVKITGSYDLLMDIMSREGMQRFRSYLHDNPGMNDWQKRRVMSAFLAKYALDEELEEELDLPGWTDELVEELTELYDADFEDIQRMPGVTTIVP